MDVPRKTHLRCTHETSSRAQACVPTCTPQARASIPSTCNPLWRAHIVARALLFTRTLLCAHDTSNAQTDRVCLLTRASPMARIPLVCTTLYAYILSISRNLHLLSSATIGCL